MSTEEIKSSLTEDQKELLKNFETVRDLFQHKLIELVNKDIGVNWIVTTDGSKPPEMIDLRSDPKEIYALSNAIFLIHGEISNIYKSAIKQNDKRKNKERSL